MRRKFSEETKRAIQDEMDKIAYKMSYKDDSEEFRLLKERYDVLSGMLQTPWKVSPDTLLIVGANLLGIMLILNHERLDIISTKALGFVIKGRV